MSNTDGTMEMVMVRGDVAIFESVGALWPLIVATVEVLEASPLVCRF